MRVSKESLVAGLGGIFLGATGFAVAATDHNQPTEALNFCAPEEMFGKKQLVIDEGIAAQAEDHLRLGKVVSFAPVDHKGCVSTQGQLGNDNWKETRIPQYRMVVR